MAAAHPTYLSPVIENPDVQKLVMAVALGVGLMLLGRALTARLGNRKGLEDAVVPAPKMTTFGFFDFFVEAFIGYHDSVLGKEYRSYVPVTGSIFLFVLLANLLGLIPGIPAITTTVWITVAMGLGVFIYFNYVGIRENGVVGYLKHFAGPVWWLAWFMFPLEIVSTLMRVLTLNLRLYWNISADHLVLEAFTGLTPYIIPVVFYALGTFVSFMQAFIFTTLSMIYILLATQHEEEGHH